MTTQLPFFSSYFNQLKLPSCSTVQNIYPTYHFPGIDFSKLKSFEIWNTRNLGGIDWASFSLTKIIQSWKPSSIKMLASWLRGVKFMQSCNNQRRPSNPLQPRIQQDWRGLVEQGCIRKNIGVFFVLEKIARWLKSHSKKGSQCCANSLLPTLFQ